MQLPRVAGRSPLARGGLIPVRCLRIRSAGPHDSARDVFQLSRSGSGSHRLFQDAGRFGQIAPVRPDYDLRRPLESCRDDRLVVVIGQLFLDAAGHHRADQAADNAAGPGRSAPAASRPMPPVATVPITAVMPPSTAPIAPPTATAVPVWEPAGSCVMIFTEVPRLPIFGTDDRNLVLRIPQVQQAMYGLIGVVNRRIHADTNRLVNLCFGFHGILSVLVPRAGTGQL